MLTFRQGRGSASHLAPTLAIAAAVAIGLLMASTANAYPGGCYKDSAGRCSYAPPEMITAEDSDIDMDAWGHNADQNFAYFVTHDDDSPFFRIIDFDLVKSQGMRLCQQLSNGVGLLEAIDDLAFVGGYTEDQASAISSSAAAVYCPWVIDRTR